MRAALVILLVIHGLIHLIGFLHGFGLEPRGFTGRTLFTLPSAFARPIAIAWLLVTLALVAAAILLAIHGDRWWLVAGIAICVSQLLIVHAWPDAKAGTIANIAIALAVVVGWAESRFQRASAAIVDAMIDRAPASAGPAIQRDNLAALPAPVRRWLEASGVVDRPPVRTVQLRQRGEIRTARDQAFMAAEAVQSFTVNPPAFVWSVHTRLMRVVPVVGRDSYADGRGRMRIEAAGLVPVVDASGPHIDQGAQLRFLGELVWFPSAALAPYVQWEAIDHESARATMRDGDITSSAVFHIDDRGRVTGLTAQRYLEDQLRTWVISIDRWNERAIPVHGDVTWRLPDGDFTYYRWEIVELAYDPKPTRRR